MPDRIEALERLARLHASGALSDEEFANEKKRILTDSDWMRAEAGNRVSLEKPGRSNPQEEELAAETFDASTTTPRDRVAGTSAWLRRNTWQVTAGIAALLLGSYFAYAAVLDLRGATLGTRQVNKKATNAARSGSEVPRMPAASASELSWLSFDDPDTCAPGPDLRRLVEDLASRQAPTDGPAGEASVRVPGIAGPVPLQIERLAVAGSRDAPVAAQVALPGVWRALQVRSLRTVSWGTSDTKAMQIRFDSPPADVRRKLQEAGFELRPVGEVRSATSGEQLVAIAIEQIAGGAALTCARR